MGTTKDSDTSISNCDGRFMSDLARNTDTG